MGPATEITLSSTEQPYPDGDRTHVDVCPVPSAALRGEFQILVAMENPPTDQ
jgi:hypothetical protein